MDIGVDTGEVEDVCLCLLHTILFHRTQGKFSFLQPEGTFSIGTVGYRDTECQNIDHVFVQNDSAELDRHVRKEVAYLLQEMHRTKGLRSLVVSMEFFEKKRAIWLFATEQVSVVINLSVYSIIKVSASSIISKTVYTQMQSSSYINNSIRRIHSLGEYVAVVASYPDALSCPYLPYLLLETVGACWYAGGFLLGSSGTGGCHSHPVCIS